MYSTALLTTTAKCDLAISKLTIEKQELEYRLEGLQRDKDGLVKRGNQNEVELVSVNSQIAAIDSIITGLNPDDPLVLEMQNKKTPLDYKKWRLENGGSSIYAILLKEAEVESFQKQIEEYTNAITAVNTHKATL